MRFAALDGWRGLAALAVAMFHFGVLHHAFGIPLIRNAGPFVDFFFVLSGFVIAHSYGNRIKDSNEAGGFLLRRFGRLWPLHVATLACLVLLEFAKWVVVSATGLSAGEAPFTGASAAAAIPAHLALLQAVGLFHDYTWNGPSWSIGCEFWTYVLFACVCLSRSRTAIAGVLIIGSVAVLVRANEAQLGSTYELGFFRCVAGFFTGVLVYSMPRRSYGTVAEIIISALALGYFTFLGPLHAASPLCSFLPLLIFPLVIHVFAGEGGQLSGLLRRRPFQALGTWSYSIYLVHFVVLTVMNSALRILDKMTGTEFSVAGAQPGEPNFVMSPWLGDLIFAVYLCVVVAIASQTWRYVEEPARLWFNALASRHAARVSAASPATR